MKIIFFFLLFCLVYSKAKKNSIDYEFFANSKNFVGENEPKKCGYDSCPKLRNDIINVHLISHSHCDAGWLKTVDQYYYGNRNLIQRAGVQYIINTAVDELLKDPNRKFIFVESVFFKKWWDDQTIERKNTVKNLVNQGRLEFINGGWVMNDEAAAHYISIIDQMTYGHVWLHENLGDCAIPKIGWQIDPFGHSKEQASLFAQMGFDGLFFGRLDFHDKIKRKLEKTMELVWKGDDDLGKQSELFTGVLPNNYNPPIGFCFDDTCADEPIIEDEKSTDYNVKRRINEFLAEVDKQAKYYRTNNLIMTMGSDFQYQNANTWYHNLDKIIKHMKKINDTVNVFYSTPTCYLKSLNDANLTWTTKEDDFFPYSSDHDAFWAGYFTSRPSFKGYERWASSHFQSTKHLQVLAGLNTEDDMNLKNELNEALAVSQHHDAITGTEKQHVFSDYVLHLDRGVDSANKLISKALDKLYNFGKYSLNTKANNVEFCKKLNVSECNITESQNKFLVHLYNPISHTIENLVRLPISLSQSFKDIQIINSLNEKIEFEIVDIPDFVRNLPERNAKANKELTFIAQLKANSITSYMISFGSSNKKIHQKASQNEISSKNEVLKGLGFDLYVDSQTGKTQKIILEDGKEIKFEQNLMYYVGMNGENRNEKDRASGAYIFRPNGTANSYEKNSKKVILDKNKNFVQISSQIDNYVAQSIKVHKDLPYVEFDYVIGPIPISDKRGKEIISRFTTDLQSNDVFYTDSNGRQLIKRIRDKRPTYTYDSETEPVASNYYPINSKIELRDESKDLRFSVVTDRSQGGSSLKSGELEIMLHRRLLHDDAFGVGEALNETGTDGKGLIIRCSHFVMISPIALKPKMHVNELVLRKTLLPMIAFRKIDSDRQFDKFFLENAKTNILKTALPECINLLTLEYKLGMKLVRFEHLYGKLDSSKCSKKTINLNLENIFSNNFGIVDSYVEMTLTANQQKANLKRLNWKYVSNNLNDTLNEDYRFGFIRSLKDALKQKKSSSTIELKPHEIKTYFVKTK